MAPSTSPSKPGGTATSQSAGPSPSKEAATATAPLQPVPTRAGPAAQALRHAAPAALLAALAAGFGPLVRNPVPAMGALLIATAAVQAAYAVASLPAAGSQQAGAGAGTTAVAVRKHRPGESKKKDVAAAAGPNIAVATTLSLLLTALSVPFLHAALVLLGAPFLTHIAETLLCAAHLATLGMFPAVYTRGTSASAWRALASGAAPLDEVAGGLWGAAAGAWLGAVPIPLDWDRDWQRWPVTVLCGMYAGAALGRALGGTVLYGRRFTKA